MNLCTNIPKPIQEFQKISFNMFKAHGLNNISCCIMAHLSVQTEEVTMDELANHTGYSLASISTATNMLINMGVVLKNKKPGSKKIYLTTNNNPTNLMEDKIKAMIETEIKDQKEKLPSIIKDLKKIIKEEENKDKINKYKEQLLIIENHYEESKFMEHIMNIVQKEIAKRKRSK
jgi:CRISPR-associated protein Cas8b1/Cst1 subtype I-B